MESDQSPAALESLRNQFVEMQLAGDAAAALRLVETAGLKVGIDAETLLLEVIVPAQHRIGELWEQNRISVADEHQATAVSYVVASFLQSFLGRTVLNRVVLDESVLDESVLAESVLAESGLDAARGADGRGGPERRSARRPRAAVAISSRPMDRIGAGATSPPQRFGEDGPGDGRDRFSPGVSSTRERVLVACVEGEQHELGARIAADLLIASGFDVSYLGTGASVQDIMEAVQDPLVSLVALSITLPLHLMSLEQVIRAVRRERPDVSIVVGGAAAARAPFADALGVVVSSGTARDFVGLVHRILDGRPAGASAGAEVLSR